MALTAQGATRADTEDVQYDVLMDVLVALDEALDRLALIDDDDLTKSSEFIIEAYKVLDGFSFHENPRR